MTDSPHPAATATVQIDNDSVRVTEYRFKPGEARAGTVMRWTTSLSPPKAGGFG